jgi:adenine phosphoribosyltransferase
MAKKKIELIKSFIRTIDNYPKQGVAFKDISPLLADVKAMKAASECLAQILPHKTISSIMAIEARGFIFGSVLAINNNASFIMIRKAAKLPPVNSNVYFDSKSEYSTEKLGFNSAFLGTGIILIHDDVLATGGTVKSVVEALKNQCGISASQIYLSFLVELTFLKGRENLIKENLIQETHIKALISY